MAGDSLSSHCGGGDGSLSQHAFTARSDRCDSAAVGVEAEVEEQITAAATIVAAAAGDVDVAAARGGAALMSL